MKRTIAVAAMVVAAIGATTGTAAAAESPTPSGYIGACNMMHGEHGMATAMNKASDRGMTGMMGAHIASGCSMA